MENKNPEQVECWVTNGYGCPYCLNGKYFDTYKCPYRTPDSPCMKKKEVVKNE